MPIVTLPSTLARLAADRHEIEVDGATAGEVLRHLEQRHERLRGWILDERGRLRTHVNVFVNDSAASLDEPVGPGDEVHVLQAISGGSGRTAAKESELLVGTKKGLFVLRGRLGEGMTVAGRHFPGQVVEYACRDPRTGRVFAAATHGQFGPHLHYTDDLDGEWTEADGPAFPEDTDASVDRVWVVEPGTSDGTLWAGVAPAALFRSTDGGASWELVRSLWEEPTRPEWQGGLGGLCLHSICPWPGEPDRLAVAVSAAGVWITEDGAATWRRGGRGLVPRYLPEEAREDTLMLCVHKMERSPVVPERLYCQFHGGVYRSDDRGVHWSDLSAEGGLPADFGFPVVVDPRDPDRAWVIPLTSDMDRVTPEGRLRVYETRDAGTTWQARHRGLPQQDAYITVLRQAFCHDGGHDGGHDGDGRLGLAFGTRTGEAFASADGGETWGCAARHLPPVSSVRPGG